METTLGKCVRKLGPGKRLPFTLCFVCYSRCRFSFLWKPPARTSFERSSDNFTSSTTRARAPMTNGRRISRLDVCHVPRLKNHRLPKQMLSESQQLAVTNRQLKPIS